MFSLCFFIPIVHFLLDIRLIVVYATIKRVPFPLDLMVSSLNDPNNKTIYYSLK